MQPWERDGVQPSHDFSAYIFPRVFAAGTLDMTEETETSRIPRGYVFVIEPKRKDPVYKMPAGHRKGGENPLQTAMRELAGETNLVLRQDRFRYIGRKWWSHPSPHWGVLFTADVDEREDLPWMNDQHAENEGEQPKFFSVDDFYSLVREGKFMSRHYRLLTDPSFTLLLPLGRDKAA
jgi:8-oxo-dGTP pyrophosphatase MutT (NUDIX family)